MTASEERGRGLAARRVVEVFRTEGVRSLVFQALARLGYRRVGWYVRELEAPIEDLDSPPDLEIVTLDVTDFDAYATLRPDVPESHFARRLRARRRCYGVRLGGRLVSASWVATGRVRLDYLSRELVLGEGELNIYDSFTDPASRGRHFQATLMGWLLRHHRARGFKMASVAIVDENRSNARSRARSSFRRVGTVGSLRLGPWRWDFTRGEAEHLPQSGEPENAG